MSEYYTYSCWRDRHFVVIQPSWGRDPERYRQELQDVRERIDYVCAQEGCGLPTGGPRYGLRWHSGQEPMTAPCCWPLYAELAEKLGVSQP